MTAAPDAGPPAVDRDNPWPGLASYDEPARDYFSGRTAETADLGRRIRDEAVTVLFGKSGLGKSSLLRAGVFPALRERGLLPISVRLRFGPDGIEPMEQVAAALFAAFDAGQIEHPPRRDGETLWEYLHREGLAFWAPKIRPARPVLVFDQFEEVFTLGRTARTQVDAFREQLADLAENRIPAALAGRLDQAGESPTGLDVHARPYKIVISLREDFLPDLEGWLTAMPTLRRNRMRLLPMGRAQAMQAVCNERTRHLVDEPLARLIVAYLAAAAGDARTDSVDEDRGATVEPSLLSLVCRGINEARKRAGNERFDATLFEAGKGHIVADFYRESLKDQPLHLRRFIEDELVTEQGFRNSFALVAAIDRGFATREQLATLVDRRLLRLEHHLGTERVELTHDLLTRAVLEGRARRLQAQRAASQRRRAWHGAIFAALIIVLVGTFVRQQLNLRHAAEAAAKTAEDAASAATAAAANDQKRLAEIETVNAELKATGNKLEAAQIETQVKNAELETALGSARTATLTAQTERQRAVDQSAISRSRELSALANAAMPTRGEVAVWLAREALRTADTPESRMVLLDAIRFAWPTSSITAVDLNGKPFATAMDAGGNQLAVLARKDGAVSVSLWDIRSRRPVKKWLRESKPPDTLTAVEFAPEGGRLLLARTGQIDSIDLDSGEPGAPIPLPLAAAGKPSSATQISVSGDGRWLAVSLEAGGIFVRDLRDPGAVWSMADGGRYGEISVAADGQRVATIQHLSSGGLLPITLERGPDGRWQQRMLALTDCVRPHSVSVASDYVVATWTAQSCTQALTADAVPSSAVGGTDDAAIEDSLLRPNGKSFLVALGNGDLLLGRGQPSDRDQAQRIRGADPSERENIRGSFALDDTATRMAMISGDAIRVVSLGRNKLLLTSPRSGAIMASGAGDWLAFASPTEDGTVVEMVHMSEVLGGNDFAHAAWRLPLTGPLKELRLVRNRLIVKTGGPTIESFETTVYDVASGAVRAGPLRGNVQLLGDDASLALLPAPPSPLSPGKGDFSAVVRIDDGSTVISSNTSGLPSQAGIIRTSRGRAALFVARPSPGATDTVTVEVFGVQKDRLIPAGRLLDLPSASLRSLTLSDDGLTLIETRRPPPSAASQAQAGAPATQRLAWRVSPDREISAGDPGSASAMPRPAPPASPDKADVIERSPSGRFTVRKAGPPADRGAWALYDGKNPAPILTFSGVGNPHPRFSDDERWLAFVEDKDLRLFDLSTLRMALRWAADISPRSIAFAADNTVLQLTNGSGQAMMVPISREALDRFATWMLLGRELTAQERRDLGLADAGTGAASSPGHGRSRGP